MWYDIGKTMTHNALINMVIGPRGYGKTFGALRKACENFKYKGEQFIYLRRYDSELKLVKDNLFDALIATEMFPFTEYKCDGDQYVFDEKVGGYAIALSRSNYYKSAAFPFVSLIIFDEFIIDTTQNLRYLPSEVRKLLDFVETVARMRENIKVFLMANSLSFVNPYTIYWNMKMPKDKKWVKAVDGLVLCELVGDDEFREKKKLTKFGKLNANTEYESMAINNQFILDSDTFIERKPGNARHVFRFTINSRTFGTWYCSSNFCFYISDDYDEFCPLFYSIKTEDHTPNNKLIAGTGKHKSLLAQTIDAYKQGRVRFETLQIKNVFMEILRRTYL